MNNNENQPTPENYRHTQPSINDDLWDLGDDTPIEEADPRTNADNDPRIVHDDAIKEAIDKTAPRINEATADTESDSKTGISLVEWAFLFFCSLILLTAGALSYKWLYQQNHLGDTNETNSLPIHGAYVTLTELSTYWKSAEGIKGVKRGTKIIPSATITIGKQSTSGIIRVRFYGDNNVLVGDNITLEIKNGKFSNNASSIEVTATDGYKKQTDFFAYQVEPKTPWKINILEAKDSKTKSSNFKELILAPISAVMD